MQLSKLTFSLASLVVLLAFGFVFGTTSVMAHLPETGLEGREHPHPLNQNLGDDPNTPDDTEPTVNAHTGHPMVTSIDLEGDNTRGTTAAVSGMAVGTTDVFTLVITFDEALTEAQTDTSPSTAFLLDGTVDFPSVILNKDKLAEATDATTPARVTIADATRVADSDGKKFEALVTIAGSFPSGTAADDHEVMYLKVNVGAAAGFGLASRPGIAVVNGGASLASDVYEFKLVNDLGDPPTPTTGVEGKITGMASLEDPFPITITFAKAVDLTAYVGKEADVIEVKGGGQVVLNSLYDDSPDDKPMTVWKATIEPYQNAAQAFGVISVTLKTTAKVKPAEEDGTLEVRADGTLVSITAPDDADDQALFVVTLTFAESLAEAVEVEETDLKVTPVDDTATTTVDEGVDIGGIGPLAGSDRKVWTVEITPVKGVATTVELSDTGKVKFGNSSAKATVPVKGAVVPPPTAGTSINVTATAATVSGITTVTLTGKIAPNGFAVIGATALPDIQRFFAEGGSISVLSSLTGAEAKSVVVSEIMWGLNLRAIGAARSAKQFIELYNTSGADLDLKDVKITFDGANTPPAAPTGMVLLDIVSNVSGVGWVITAAPGSSGRIAVPNDVTTFVPSDLVSMYRKINYAKVEKADHDAADAVKNRTAQLKDFPNGNALGSWAASNTSDTYGVNLIGSPGAKHFVAYATLTSSPVDRSLVIINEIGNHGDDKYDWVELRNVSSGEVNLKKWELSQVTKDKKDTQLVSFPDNDNHKIGAGDVLLLVNSDPYRDPSHPIAAGTRINGAKAETTGLKGESRYYVDGGLQLANADDTLLILRNANDKEGKPAAFKDVVGTLSIVDNAASLRTSLWPLRATGAPDKNVIDGDADNKQDDFRSGIVYRRGDASGGTGEKDLARVGYTGVGYKRSAAKSNQNGGTPGYPNGAVIDTDTLADAASVTISEVMYARGRNLPQWIELYNSSTTQAVNLNEWKLRLENADDVDIRTTVTTNNLGGTIIPPNQTVLIVSSTTGRFSRAAQGGIDFPVSRVIDMWGQKDKLEVATGLTRRTYSLLSQTAFKITLIAKGGAAADVVGNLGADGTAMWALPMLDPEEGEGRSSIIRRYDEGVARAGTMAPPGDGTGAWVLASKSSLSEVRFNETYYGSPDDVGTPGYHGGGALPVSLSKFRPERLDSGEIVVRWITESELNNAGFNILRSDARDGEFTKLNTKLIAGQGTTSERTVYEFPDTSAKPNVVYYYQIQDVSLDGKVQTLRQSRIKGYVSPSGKLTTTWGDLKLQD